jgi:hypothetical protein
MFKNEVPFIYCIPIACLISDCQPTTGSTAVAIGEEEGDVGELCRSTTLRVRGELRSTTILTGEEKDEELYRSTATLSVEGEANDEDLCRSTTALTWRTRVICAGQLQLYLGSRVRKCMSTAAVPAEEG